MIIPTRVTVSAASQSLRLLLLMACYWPLALFAAQTTATPATDPPATPPLPAQAWRYVAQLEKGLTLDGFAINRLQPEADGNWRFSLDVETTIARINESVVFRWAGDQLVPLRYRYRLSGLLIPDRETHIDFDWATHTATSRHKGQTQLVPITSGVKDPLGFQLQLRVDAMAGKRQMQYLVLKKGKLREMDFAVVETIVPETIIPETIELRLLRPPGKTRETRIWLAPAQGFLLYRLVQSEPDGEHYEILLDAAAL